MPTESTETTSVTMTAREFRHLSTIAHYTRSDEAQPILTYVRLTTTGDNCEAVATDSYVLARRRGDMGTPYERRVMKWTLRTLVALAFLGFMTLIVSIGSMFEERYR